MFNMTLQMWFSGQVALGLRGHSFLLLWCVVYSNIGCRLGLSCWCRISCGTRQEKDVDKVGERPPRLLLWPSRAPKTFLDFNITTWMCCLSLWAVLSGFFPNAVSHRASDSYDMFSLNSHPILSIFILDSITSWFQQRPVLYCSPMCVATPQIYVGAEGWLSNFLHG